MKRLFVDTNIFLQCHDIKTVDWSEISKDSDIELFIPRAAQKEIDKLKQNSNGRRAKRARSANTCFGKILESPDKKILIRESNPKVFLTFSPRNPPAKHLPEGIFLDRDSLDDSIIFELLAYHEKFPDSDIAILTDDTNLKITAEQVGLSYIPIPSSWQLKPESDERDKKIAQLENKIKILENNFPNIKASISERNKGIDKIEFEIVKCPDLSEEEIDYLIDEIKKTKPMKAKFDEETPPLFSNSVREIAWLTGKYVPPPVEEVTEYQNKKYPEWINNARESLKKISKSIEHERNFLNLNITLENIGTLPADNLLVNFSITNGFVILDGNNEDKTLRIVREAWKLPPPPNPPEGHYAPRTIAGRLSMSSPALNLGRLSSTDHLGSLLRDFNVNSSKDNNAFYWRHSPISGDQYLESTCTEFKHKIHTEIFSIDIEPSLNSDPKGGLFTLTISASNLPEPVEIKLPIHITCKELNTLSEAKKLCNL